MFKTVRKNAFNKNSKAKRGNCFNRENFVLIFCNIIQKVKLWLN